MAVLRRPPFAPKDAAAWYPRDRAAINAALPALLPTLAANLALLVRAPLAKRTLFLIELARLPHPARAPCPRAQARPAPPPQAAVALPGQRAGRPPRRSVRRHSPCVRPPGWLGLAIDRSMFDAKLPGGRRVRSQALRITVLCRGRAVRERAARGPPLQPIAGEQSKPLSIRIDQYQAGTPARS
jgi:hypothetical protein